MANIYASIWQDIYYTGTEDAYEYQVMVDSETIYSGKAFIKPNGTSFSINISKICQDYLSNDMDDFRTDTSATHTHSGAYRLFQLYHDGSVVNNYYFLYCWDYSTKFSGSSLTLSHPINGHYYTGMKKMYTTYSSSAVKTTVKTGTQTGYTTLKCGSGALYYKNRSGGWDSFLIEGSAIKSDTYEKYSYNRSFDNNTIEFEEGTYHNQIETAWTLHTGWLKDSESKLLAFHLIPSNAVYFHDFESDSIVPVIISDDSITYKTYHNNSNKLVNYTITIKESQKKQML